MGYKIHVLHTEDGPLAATVQNCIRNFRLQLAKDPPCTLGASWVLALGAQRPLKEAAAAKLVGHTGKEWTAAGCPGAVLALVQTGRLMSPLEAKRSYANRADTCAYSWKSAPGKPRVAATGAKGTRRLRKRNRFGDGKEYRSGPNTRLQPPVLRSTRFRPNCSAPAGRGGVGHLLWMRARRLAHQGGQSTPPMGRRAACS